MLKVVSHLNLITAALQSNGFYGSYLVFILKYPYLTAADKPLVKFFSLSASGEKENPVFFFHFLSNKNEEFMGGNYLLMTDCRCYLCNHGLQNCFRLHTIRFQRKMLSNSNNFLFFSLKSSTFGFLICLHVTKVSCKLLMVCISITFWLSRYDLSFYFWSFPSSTQ